MPESIASSSVDSVSTHDGGALPSIAVVIPCYNGEKWVARAITSVLDQRYPSLEVIVIDDGSRDRSVDVIRRFGDRVKWFSGQNNGACVARNTGLALCESEYILFLDADDYLSGDYIRGLGCRAGETAADMVLGRGVEEFPDGSRRERHFYEEPLAAIDLLTKILSREGLQTSQVLWRKAFLARIGGWNRAVLISQDVELSVRGLLAKPTISSSSTGNSVWNRHSGPSISKISGRPALESGLKWFDSVRDQIASCNHGDLKTSYGRMYYSLAIMAYAANCPDVGNQALESRAKLGISYHEGSLLHRVACNIVGLRGKTAISRAVKGRLGLIRGRSNPMIRGEA